jgi:hypothetical protein
MFDRSPVIDASVNIIIKNHVTPDKRRKGLVATNPVLVNAIVAA